MPEVWFLGTQRCDLSTPQDQEMPRFGKRTQRGSTRRHPGLTGASVVLVAGVDHHSGHREGIECALKREKNAEAPIVASKIVAFRACFAGCPFD